MPQENLDPLVNSVPSLEKVNPAKVNQYEELVQGLKLNYETIQRVRKIFEKEMDLGLESTKKSCLQMANTYIPQLPDGTESGEYLALDLGGTNFRILLLQIENGQMNIQKVKNYNIEEKLRLGHGTHLFDYLAKCIHSFMSDNNLLDRHLPLGFTFSFPMHQKSLSSAYLVSWTKSFNCPGVVDEDVVDMLNKAIKRRGDINVHVVAVLNDTTGTLINGAYLDPRCCVGLILGTGSNACYMEKIDKIQNWEGEKPSDVKEVIIDIEDGAFGDNGLIDFIKTDYDREVDNNSLLPSSFTFEKYFAGRYIGEIVRVVLCKLAKCGVIFGGELSEKLTLPDAFKANFLSDIELDSINGSTTNCRMILEGFNQSYDEEDIAIIKNLCYLITERAAKLVSLTLAVLLDRMNKPEVTIAIDGSLYKFHPRLDSLLKHYIAQYAPQKKFQLLLAEDGSGKGAGLTAAIAMKLQKKT